VNCEQQEHISGAVLCCYELDCVIALCNIHALHCVLLHCIQSVYYTVYFTVYWTFLNQCIVLYSISAMHCILHCIK